MKVVANRGSSWCDPSTDLRPGHALRCGLGCQRSTASSPVITVNAWATGPSAEWCRVTKVAVPEGHSSRGVAGRTVGADTAACGWFARLSKRGGGPGDQVVSHGAHSACRRWL